MPRAFTAQPASDLPVARTCIACKSLTEPRLEVSRSQGFSMAITWRELTDAWAPRKIINFQLFQNGTQMGLIYLQFVCCLVSLVFRHFFELFEVPP